MTSEELEIKNGFRSLAEKVIDSQDSIDIFKGRWESGDYRLAYLVVIESLKRQGRELDKEESELEKKFYWLFVN